MKEQRSWACEIVFSLLFGVPLYAAGFDSFGWPLALLVHLIMFAVYGVFLRDFGRGSAIEMDVFVWILAALVAICLPIFQRGTKNLRAGKSFLGLSTLQVLAARENIQK